jgi:hypothetical protein
MINTAVAAAFRRMDNYILNRFIEQPAPPQLALSVIAPLPSLKNALLLSSRFVQTLPIFNPVPASLHMDTHDLLNAHNPAELRVTRLADGNGSEATSAQTEPPESEGERLFVHEIRREKHGRPKLVIDFAPR